MINTFGIQVKCGIHERKMSKCSETYQWDFLLKLLSIAFLSVYFSLVAFDQKRICLCYGSPCRWLKHFCENCLMQRSHNFDNIFSFQAYLTINILGQLWLKMGPQSSGQISSMTKPCTKTGIWRKLWSIVLCCINKSYWDHNHHNIHLNRRSNFSSHRRTSNSCTKQSGIYPSREDVRQIVEYGKHEYSTDNFLKLLKGYFTP